jgi:hypothetical protein
VTVSSTTNRVSYSGNGSTTAFAFSHPFRLTADLVVTVRTTATGAESLKTEGSDYTVSGTSDAGTGGYSSGTVTFGTAPASGTQVHIDRVVTRTQTADYISGDGIPPASIEGALDKLSLAVQELDSRFGRTLLQPRTAANRNLVLPEPGTTVASRYLRVNAAGTGYELTGTAQTTQISVKDFGALGDGVTDDTAAINAAFQWIRDTIFEVTETEPSFVVAFPYGKYRTTGPINATGIRNRVWGIVGPGKIQADFNSGVVLDLTFSRFCTIRDLHIGTASGKTPDIGVLIARENNGFVADDFHFQNLHVVGVFANACLYNYASEDFTGINCSFLNDSASTSAYCIRLDGTNSASVTSTFQAIPANTAASFNSVVFIECDARRANGGPCLYVARSDGFRFYACYMATTTLANVHINTTSAIFNRDLYLDIHFETTGMDSCIEFRGDATQTINGLTVIDYNPFCSDEIFKTGSGVTSVTLIAPYIRIRNTNNGVAPTNGVFNSASEFKFRRPDISVWVANAPVFELYDGMTVGHSAVAVTHTGNTSETTLATVSLPANVMGANGRLRITSYWTYTNSANNKTLQIRCGTTGNGLTGSIWGSTTQTTTRSMRMQNEICNRNSTSSQVLMNGIGTGGWGTTVNAASTDTRDTTVAQDIVLTAQLASSGESITLEYYHVELLLN